MIGGVGGEMWRRGVSACCPDDTTSSATTLIRVCSSSNSCQDNAKLNTPLGVLADVKLANTRRFDHLMGLAMYHPHSK